MPLSNSRYNLRRLKTKSKKTNNSPRCSCHRVPSYRLIRFLLNEIHECRNEDNKPMYREYLQEYYKFVGNKKMIHKLKLTSELYKIRLMLAEELYSNRHILLDFMHQEKFCYNYLGDDNDNYIDNIIFSSDDEDWEKCREEVVETKTSYPNMCIIN